MISYRRFSAFALVVAVLFLATSTMAGTFVSYKGKFAVSYPPNWKQIDYNTVDYYLSQGQATPQSFQYEAVFADSTFDPFQAGAYVIMTLDTGTGLSQQRMDSLRDDFVRMFGGNSRTAPSDDIMAALVLDTPVVSPDGRLIAVQMDVTEPGQDKRMSVAAVKIYENGVVNFYFYAPDSMMTSARAAFQTVVASFTTDIASAKPREDVKVADQDKVSGNNGRRSIIPIGSGIAIVLIVIMVLRRKRRAQQRSTGTGV